MVYSTIDIPFQYIVTFSRRSTPIYYGEVCLLSSTSKWKQCFDRRAAARAMASAVSAFPILGRYDLRYIFVMSQISGLCVPAKQYYSNRISYNSTSPKFEQVPGLAFAPPTLLETFQRFSCEAASSNWSALVIGDCSVILILHFGSAVDSSVRFCEDVQMAIYLILSENMATRVTRDDHCLDL